nr:MAG TPA: hypothetical protein [Caudoviricetes sp.]
MLNKILIKILNYKLHHKIVCKHCANCNYDCDECNIYIMMNTILKE